MKLSVITLAVTILATPALANTMTVLYPEEPCSEILAADFSSPGSDSARYTLELLCRDDAGKVRMFMTNWMTGAAFLGFSRASVPDQIDFVPSARVKTLQIQR